MQKIGIFGGTFDPPHFGHIHLALSMMEQCGLDQVVWIPTLINPFKLERPPISFAHRYQMVLRAVEGIDHFVVDPIESFREPPSYTIDTVSALIEASQNESEFYLILANDHLVDLDRWKDVNKLLDMVTPLVGARELNPSNIEGLNLEEKYKNLLKENMIQIPVFQVSATDIRNRIRGGRYCGHLVPRSTLDYIHTNRLYY